MRDELREDASDADLVGTLVSTEVVLVSDADNVSSHAAQSAYITAALLMARSGHRVYFAAPDVPLAGRQPPLRGNYLVSSLIDAGQDLLPGIEFSVTPPAHCVDLCIVFGSSRLRVDARHTISLNASAWSAYLRTRQGTSRWRECDWPLGSLAAGVLATVEAFKIAMLKLRRFARAPSNFEKLFALCHDVRVDLARSEARKMFELEPIDFVSGGAITNAVLYCLLRVARINGAGRIVENTCSDYSNLNRYALLRRSQVLEAKGETLQSFDTGNFKLQSAPVRYDVQSAMTLAPLAPRVLVGVDHIPTRWLVQQLEPDWLGVGATTHWNAMASFHESGLACACCLHPRDDDNDAAIPTVAFVSFWSGLLLTAYLLRSVAGEALASCEQHVFLTPMRPEAIWRGAVNRRPHCRVCGRSVRAA